jgi:hypothetical protein
MRRQGEKGDKSQQSTAKTGKVDGGSEAEGGVSVAISPLDHLQLQLELLALAVV